MTETTNVNTIGSIPEYNVLDDWNIYFERLEHFMKVNHIEYEKKSLLLVMVIGQQAYKILRDICEPILPENTPYNQLCTILKKEFALKIPVFRKRVEFYKLHQLTNESVSDWFERIRNNVSCCQFGSRVEDVLKDKFISGMYDGPVQEQMCEEDPSKELSDLVNIALNIEFTLKKDKYPSNEINVVTSHAKETDKEQRNDDILDNNEIADELKDNLEKDEPEKVNILRKNSNEIHDRVDDIDNKISKKVDKANYGKLYENFYEKVGKTVEKDIDENITSTNSVSGKCGNCGKIKHIFSKYKKYKCEHCTRFGHITSVCEYKDMRPIDSFQGKPVQNWELADFKNWVVHYADSKRINYQDIKLHAFNNWENYTIAMKTRNDFLMCDPGYGHTLYQALQRHMQQYFPEENNRVPSMNVNTSATYCDLTFNPVIPVTVQDDYNYGTHSYNPNINNFSAHDSDEYSSTNNNSDAEDPVIQQNVMIKIKRPVGRPRGRKCPRRERKEKIWEFLRNLLHDPQYCPRLIRWEDHKNGIFRFVSTDEVAKKWGLRNNNTKMNYEKLSRAMRYYYSKKILEAVPEKRLVYKFGPNAKNWETSNPNFEN